MRLFYPAKNAFNHIPPKDRGLRNVAWNLLHVLRLRFIVRYSIFPRGDIWPFMQWRVKKLSC